MIVCISAWQIVGLVPMHIKTSHLGLQILIPTPGLVKWSSVANISLLIFAFIWKVEQQYWSPLLSSPHSFILSKVLHIHVQTTKHHILVSRDQSHASTGALPHKDIFMNTNYFQNASNSTTLSALLWNHGGIAASVYQSWISALLPQSTYLH